MIAQVLRRDYVLRRMEATLGCLERPPEALPDYARELSPEQFAEAARALQAATVAERSGSSASTPQAGTGARDPGTSDLDELAFISRDPIVNLLQSAVEEYFLTQEPDRIQTIARPPGQRSLAEDVPVTDLVIAPMRAPAPGERLAQPFEIPSDPKWVCCKLAEWLGGGHRHPFVPTPAPTIQIADDARVVLVGDWGTGLPRARKVAEQIRHALEEPDAARRERHVIHLGDVYYSGWPFEVQRRFLAHWPVKEGEADSIGSFSLNGNHEMFSGGNGYFDTLLGDPRFARQASASFFKLANGHWQLLGLDTAYDEHRLAEPQPEWLSTELSADDRKAILLSHHQLFGANGRPVEQLESQVATLLQAGGIRAWFWGHEHGCVLYEPHAGIPFARCVGHGGVPVYMWRRKSARYRPPVAYEYREYIRNGLERWALLGFALLDFEGAEIHVRYVDELGRSHKTETIT